MVIEIAPCCKTIFDVCQVSFSASSFLPVSQFFDKISTPPLVVDVPAPILISFYNIKLRLVKVVLWFEQMSTSELDY